MSFFQIREFEFNKDYEPVLNLWQNIEAGIRVGRSDTPEEVHKKVQRDPDLFLVAEADGCIVGSIIGGFDGRRGLIHHLAVQREFRRMGVGQALLAEVEKRLQIKGCLKCILVVLEDNINAIRFYEECGWNRASDDVVFAKEF